MALLLTIFLLVLPTKEDTNVLSEARVLFFSFDQPGCVSETLFEILQQSNAKSNVLLAYEGAAEASSASCISFPLSKLKRFNQGKSKINQAVLNEPNNLEIRFIRYSIQSKAPAFLGYNTEIENDLNFLIQTLSGDKTALKDEFLRKNIIKFLLDSSSVTSEQLADLQAIAKND